MTTPADRLDELAETAELMGDTDTSIRLRQRAERLRLEEMRRLDDDPPPMYPM